MGWPCLFGDETRPLRPASSVRWAAGVPDRVLVHWAQGHRGRGWSKPLALRQPPAAALGAGVRLAEH